MTKVIRNANVNFSLVEDIVKILPEQGCIEIQRDGPNKVHEWHQHPNEETLIILKGEITFSLGSGEYVCGPSDVLRLSANDRHKATAGPEGSIYLIVFHGFDIRQSVRNNPQPIDLTEGLQVSPAHDLSGYSK